MRTPNVWVVGSMWTPADNGGRVGVKNWQNLEDVFYGRPPTLITLSFSTVWLEILIEILTR